MSREEVLKKLKEIGIDGEFIKEDNKTVLSLEEESNSKELKDITPISPEDSKGQEKV